jgi:hypothetical protein
MDGAQRRPGRAGSGGLRQLGLLEPDDLVLVVNAGRTRGNEGARGSNESAHRNEARSIEFRDPAGTKRGR